MKQVQSVSHTFYKEGGQNMNKQPEIETYIEINGEKIRFQSLSEKRQCDFSALLQDRMMERVGYRRVNTGHHGD